MQRSEYNNEADNGWSFSSSRSVPPNSGQASSSGSSQHHQQELLAVDSLSSPGHAIQAGHHTPAGPAVGSVVSDQQSALQVPSQAVCSLPVNALTTTVLVVPEGVQLPAHDKATDQDQVYFRLHYLVPSTQSTEETQWTREFVNHELIRIMLSNVNWKETMLHRGGTSWRFSEHRGIKIGETCPPVNTGAALTVDPALSEMYEDWAEFHTSAWELKFVVCRTGCRGNMRSNVLTDLHATSRQIAKITSEAYIGRGGTVYTETVVVMI